MTNDLKLMLFTHDSAFAKQAEDAGIDRIVVDFEFRGKAARQSGYHLEVNKASLSELKEIRKAVTIPVLARTNPIWSESREEISAIISEGADIVMLPMFRTKYEVHKFIEFAGKGIKKNLLFETKKSVEIVRELHPFQFDEYYIGLNDMAVDYGLSFAYDVLQHNVVSHIRQSLPDRPFGFGGITVSDGGSPLTTRKIMKQMAKYNCSLAILRRAFKRDIQGRTMGMEVLKIRELYRKLI